MLAAAADDVLAGFGHRFMTVEHPALGTRVAPGLADLGYREEDHVFMALRRPRDRAPAPGLAREVGETEHEAVEAATTAELPYGRDPAVVAALTAGRRLLPAAAPRTRVVVASADGQDVAHATLYADGRVAQVEDVATLTRARGRGLARSCRWPATWPRATARLPRRRPGRLAQGPLRAPGLRSRRPRLGLHAGAGLTRRGGQAGSTSWPPAKSWASRT